MGDHDRQSRLEVFFGADGFAMETLAQAPLIVQTLGLAGCEISRKRPSSQIAASTDRRSATYQQSSQPVEQLQRIPKPVPGAWPAFRLGIDHHMSLPTPTVTQVRAGCIPATPECHGACFGVPPGRFLQVKIADGRCIPSSSVAPCQLHDLRRHLGENCLARDRSNTPLQALSLLNDDMFLGACHSVGTYRA